MAFIKIEIKKDDLVDCINNSIKVKERAANSAPNDLIKQAYKDIAQSLRNSLNTITEVTK